MKGIPLYKDINHLHALTGASIRTKNDLFHCFDMSETNNLTVNSLPPHRADFYCLALNFGTKNLEYTLNETKFKNPEHFILCVAAGQVAKWEKKGDWFGFCIFFKSEFLQYSSEINFLKQFPFFNIGETNLIPVNESQFKSLTPSYRQILVEQQNDSNYSVEIIRSFFQTILWQVRRIYENAKSDATIQRASLVIASQFQYLVNMHFLDKVAVEQYALLLNITTNHLSQIIKSTTGKTAKSIISQRRLEEAKYLLLYTQNDFAEITYHLNFSEPTHFSKFFKKQTNQTPVQYRADRC